MNKITKDQLEVHPYGDFVIPKTRLFIIGSFPIGKFTNPLRRSEIKQNEIDFYYGGESNLLWKSISDVFSTDLNSKPKIVSFLQSQGISIADVIKQCRRKNGSALDKDLYDITWNLELKNILNCAIHPKILFTSKKVQAWFQKNIFPNYPGESESLISPSPAANIGISTSLEFKEWKKSNPSGKTNEFRLYKYRLCFKT